MNQEEEEDPWADKTKEINFSTKSPDKIIETSTTSSDEEENDITAKKPKKMEVDGDDEDDEGTSDEIFHHSDHSDTMKNQKRNISI